MLTINSEQMLVNNVRDWRVSDVLFRRTLKAASGLGSSRLTTKVFVASAGGVARAVQS